MGSTTPAPVQDAIEKVEMPPLWKVVLLDDDEHTYDYVIEMLMKLFLKTVDEAYRHAVEVDTLGRTVVMICEREAAEFARDEIHGYGADWRLPRSKGSMSATLEPAGGPAVA
jgi:ATP-dependent Clp protease adaptor protein ClpS